MSFLTRLAQVCLALSFAALCAAIAVQRPALAQVRPSAPPSPKTDAAPSGAFDIRLIAPQRTQALRGLGRDPQADGAARLRQASQAIAALKARLPGAEVRLSPLTGSAELVRVARGSLTPAAPGVSARAIATGFLQEQAALYGLTAADVASLAFRGESVSRAGGLRMVRLEQMVNGRPIFQSDSRFLIDREGRLIRTIGQLVPTMGARGAPAAPAAPSVTPAQALVVALQSVGITVAEAAITVTPGTPGTPRDQLTVANPQVGGPVTSHLVYFPLAPGVLALAYEQATLTTGAGDWLTLVDATTGTLLWRKNVRSYQAAPTQAARFGVYVQADGRTPADSPAPHSPSLAVRGAGTQAPAIARTVVTMADAQDLIASPSGWLADNAETTTGNNVDACTDRTLPDGCDAGELDSNGRPIGNPDSFLRNRDFLGAGVRSFAALPAPLAGNPDAGTEPAGTGPDQESLRRVAATQLFYTTNWYHDRLFQLGFDEAAGNFQTVNFSGQGVGGDHVRAEVQDRSGTNNANFSTFPDGTSGRIQMYIFDGSTPGRDGALDTEIVIHELTHGLSNRLIGNGAGLMWSVGQALGEGWGDFYALSLLNATQADDPDARYAMGAYATYKLEGLTDNYVYGIRRFPYSTDNSVNPLTWADVDDVTADLSGGIPVSPLDAQFVSGALEVHNAGEVWALTLWEVRSRVIKDPAGANGNVAIGNETMLQLVTDAMKLTPINPSVIDARDALLDADCATNACANERWIWEGFADRGLGYGAIAPLGTAGFDNLGHMGVGTSAALPALDVAGYAIDDVGGNHNGGVDPGEPIRLGVTLTNPWRRATAGVAGATATLTSATPGVTIINGTATYLAIPAAGTASPSAGGFVFTAAPSLTCGQAIRFTLTITSALGTSSSELAMRVGLPSGLGTPVTFTRTTNRPLPDNDPRGVVDRLTIPDDFEIADLDFRLDRLDHTFSGDVTVMLRAPNGYGTDLIWLRGTLFAAGDGDDFIDTIIDQSSMNDLHQALDEEAPFTGRWAPAFNSGVWSLFGTPDLYPDPVGQLSRLNGLSTRGDWHVQAADNGALDTGTLRGWSLIVTPRAFTCAPFTETTPPITTITLTPPAPTGANGWYRTTVQAAVAATDGPGGLVTETRCVLDPAAPPATFAHLPAGCAFGGAGATVTADGTHTLWAASLDAAGNAGLPIAQPIRIDRTPPVVTCPATPPRFWREQEEATMTATVTDALSGAPATVTAAVDTSTPGNRTLTLSASDAAGNVGTATCGYEVGSVRTYYLTEGSTGFYDLSVAIANPHSVPAPITLTLLKDDTTTDVLPRTLPPMSRTTIAVKDLPGFEAIPISVVVTSLQGLPLGVERTMTWDARAYGGHTETAVPQPRRKWMFAEGAQGFFQTYVFVLNPNEEPTTATVRFLRETGAPVTRTYPLPAFSRMVVDAGAVPEIAASAFGVVVDAPLPVVAERVTYFGRTPSHLFVGGHASAGAPDASTRWYFAEGATGPIFDTYILVANPGTIDATVHLRFLMDTGEVIEHERPVAAGARLSVDVEALGPRFSTAAFSLELTTDQPVVAERAMYWVGDYQPWTEGHDSLGVTTSATRWVVAEGRVGGPLSHQTYLLLGNPAATAATVRVTFLRTGAEPVVKEYPVAATSRTNIFVNDQVPELSNEPFSAIVEVLTGAGIVVERSMYWDAEGKPWAGGTNANATRLP